MPTINAGQSLTQAGLTITVLTGQPAVTVTITTQGVPADAGHSVQAAWAIAVSNGTLTGKAVTAPGNLASKFYIGPNPNMPWPDSGIDWFELPTGGLAQARTAVMPANVLPYLVFGI